MSFNVDTNQEVARRRIADCKLRQRIGNFHDAFCGVVDVYDTTPQRSVVASP